MTADQERRLRLLSYSIAYGDEVTAAIAEIARLRKALRAIQGTKRGCDWMRETARRTLDAERG